MGVFNTLKSHFVLAREGLAAHLASRHAPWKKGILYVEDRGIVLHWCMWLLVSVAAATLWWQMRYEVAADFIGYKNLKNSVFVLQMCTGN